MSRDIDAICCSIEDLLVEIQDGEAEIRKEVEAEIWEKADAKIQEANIKIEKLQTVIHGILGTKTLGDLPCRGKALQELLRPLVDVIIETS